MNKVIFARPRHHYRPYEDFFRLVELSGFDADYLDQVNWQDPDLTVIATPKHPEWDQVIPPGHKARLIWWTLERGHHEEPPMDMSNPFRPPYVDEVWASDKAFAEQIGARYVFLGGHPAFGGVDYTRPKQNAIITLMYLSGRRQALIGGLAGLSCGDAPNGLWGEERDRHLKASRLIVSAHQDDYPWSEPIRFMIAGCYAMPLLSETCQDSGHWVDGFHYESATLNMIPAKARFMLQDDLKLRRLGAAAWRLVCTERPFRQEVKAAL